MIRGQSGQTIGSQMLDASTGAAFAGAVTVYITGDGGTQAIGSVGAGLCVHEGNGYHTYTPSAAETNFALIAFTFIGSGAIPVTIQVTTLTLGQTTVVGNVPASAAAVSSQTLVTGALQLIGVVAESETPTYAQLQDGHRRLNMMLRSWALQPRTLLITEREVFTMTAGKGSPSNPYTIGPGGDLNTARPVSVLGAATLLTSAAPTQETFLTVYTDAMYFGQSNKALSNGLGAGVWYQPTSPLGKLYLYPVPDVATNDLVLYLQKPLANFAAMTTSYDLPDGAEEAIEYNLAVRLCPVYSVAVPPDVQQLARVSLSTLKRSTYQLVDLPSPFTGGGWYDIYAGR